MIDDVRWAHSIRTQVRELDHTLLHHTLANSQGSDTMSPEDMKIAIVALRGMVTHQGDLIDALVHHITEEKPKTFFGKIRTFFKN